MKEGKFSVQISWNIFKICRLTAEQLKFLPFTLENSQVTYHEYNIYFLKYWIALSQIILPRGGNTLSQHHNSIEFILFRPFYLPMLLYILSWWEGLESKAKIALTLGNCNNPLYHWMLQHQCPDTEITAFASDRLFCAIPKDPSHHPWMKDQHNK